MLSFSVAGLLFSPGFQIFRNITDSPEFASIYPIPKISNKALTFAEVTDMRAGELAATFEKDDRPIVIMWSGGIDSTVIIAAIIKHWPRSLLDRVVVRMNNSSYVENPFFYNNVIVKHNLTTEMTETTTKENAFTIFGEPADALWMQARLVDLAGAMPGMHEYNIHKHKKWMIDYLASFSNLDIAEWAYEAIPANAAKSGVELRNLSDFFWWMTFGSNYSNMCLKHLCEYTTHDYPGMFRNYTRDVIPWYATDDYQIWSMQARSNDHVDRFDGTPRGFKMPAKEYIFAVDRNTYYRDYKSKVRSYYSSLEVITSLNAIYDDGTVIFNSIDKKP